MPISKKGRKIVISTSEQRSNFTAEQEILDTMSVIRFHLLRGRSQRPDVVKIIRPSRSGLEGQIAITFRSKANLNKYTKKELHKHGISTVGR